MNVLFIDPVSLIILQEYCTVSLNSLFQMTKPEEPTISFERERERMCVCLCVCVCVPKLHVSVTVSVINDRASNVK